ncbi:50S ribosomal protein L23 [Candidatus Roizmanbacteria bacterium RIFCSPLOWO2_01_FULL_38_12]|uniref:Large ribosomal subunit protein uL23 n=1 Tax=Candidatus Roizmanbacteria bacterium RIFCSPLOWO2_01_FULL_38_12 TaxID=1802061 RepID=A0A1F7IXY4_9BACT|nr:MAG: 50S ribosomal protein L23 [Candidatus Roizmanbacteria bacterium RIFCSPHIGHO2_12_FULL_38_13]OGK48232.1 MAG: 50S ribosomal protein L23 [Candidatus Roizmanbacteria bacterium RIFCSPLOWO2_01_FULL_38_12]
MKSNEVIIRPIITEKSSTLAQASVYAFEVNKRANKHQISKALEDLYKVSISSVSVITRKGKEKRIGRRMVPRILPDKKIAYIKVTKGTIDLFPQS